MTKVYIDSKSVNYDRRSALFGAAAIPLAAVPFIPSTSIAGENDKAITKMVTEYVRLSNSIDKMNEAGELTDEFVEATMEAAHEVCDRGKLSETPSDTVVGLREKVRYLRMPENFNDGYFSKRSSNTHVLMSLFSDIEKLAEELS